MQSRALPTYIRVSLAGRGRIDDGEGCGVSCPLYYGSSIQCSIIPSSSVMGPTGAGKSTVRSHPIIYLLYVNGRAPSLLNMRRVKMAEQLVINCGLAHRRFELSELPIPPAAILFS